MGSKINRIGERNINTFGSEMVIIDYRNANNIDVYFPEYNWIYKNACHQSFKKGNIKCPYERSIYGIGYLGEGDYKVSKNLKHTRIYDTWHHMLQRCYDKKWHEKYPTYKDCSANEEWYNFQNFAEWDNDNFYIVEGQRMCLDKDILVKHNKIYSPDTCIYVPQTINKLFTKNDKNRGESVIGTSPLENGKYQVHCSLINPKTGKSKYEHLGCYETQEKAFKIYKYYKEKNIKIVADYFKKEIPERLYNGLYNYTVELTG